MKTMKNIFKGRFLALALALVLLALALVSCGGQTVATLSYDKDKLSFKTQEEFDEHALTPTELESILDIFVSAYSASDPFDAREALIAANRGYDITKGSENDFDKEYKDLGFSLDAATAVIKKANSVAASDDKLSDAELEVILEKIEAAPEKFEADVEMMISSMAKDINPTTPGLWDNIMIGIGAVLNWITNILGFKNYVLGICIFSVLIEILMIPFAIKQQKNSIKQANLRPKEMAIKNKYKGRTDQPTMQKMQAEIQELYQRENFSPASGCLPLLIQLPIIMILYSIVMDPLHYVLGMDGSLTEVLNTFASTCREAGGLGLSVDVNRGSIALLSTIGDQSGAVELLRNFSFYNFGDGVLDSLGSALENVPNFNVGPLNFGMTPGFDGGWERLVLLSVPVVTFVTYFVSSKLNRKLMYQSTLNDPSNPQMACSNNMMDIMMPAMSTFFTLAVPAVIGVYWVVRSWLGLLKTFIMSRVMPLPTFTEEDYKAAAKEMAGKKPVKKSERAGAVRSLHYIDDEDFEDTRERGLARRAAIEEKEKEEAASRERNAKMAPAPIKEDRKSKKESSGKEKNDEEKTDDAKESASDDNNKDEV